MPRGDDLAELLFWIGLTIALAVVAVKLLV